MTELKEVAYDALREMYSEAEPPLDFDHLRENPDEYPDDWYEQHALDGERQREIVDKHINEHQLSRREKTQVTMTAILDYGPTTTEPQEMEA